MIEVQSVCLKFYRPFQQKLWLKCALRDLHVVHLNPLRYFIATHDNSVLSWLLTLLLNKHQPAARRPTCDWWYSFTLTVSVWNSICCFTYGLVFTKSCTCDRSGLSFSLNQLTKDAHCLRYVHSELQMLRYCVCNSDLGRMQHDCTATELPSSMLISITHPHMHRKKGLWK